MGVQEQQSAQLVAEEDELKRRIEECRRRIARAERVKEMHRGFEKNEVEGFKGTILGPLRAGVNMSRIAAVFEGG